MPDRMPIAGYHKKEVSFVNMFVLRHTHFCTNPHRVVGYPIPFPSMVGFIPLLFVVRFSLFILHVLHSRNYIHSHGIVHRAAWQHQLLKCPHFPWINLTKIPILWPSNSKLKLQIRKNLKNLAGHQVRELHVRAEGHGSPEAHWLWPQCLEPAWDGWIMMNQWWMIPMSFDHSGLMSPLWCLFAQTWQWRIPHSYPFISSYFPFEKWWFLSHVHDLPPPAIFPRQSLGAQYQDGGILWHLGLHCPGGTGRRATCSGWIGGFRVDRVENLGRRCWTRPTAPSAIWRLAWGWREVMQGAFLNFLDRQFMQLGNSFDHFWSILWGKSQQNLCVFLWWQMDGHGISTVSQPFDSSEIRVFTARRPRGCLPIPRHHRGTIFNPGGVWVSLCTSSSLAVCPLPALNSIKLSASCPACTTWRMRTVAMAMEFTFLFFSGAILLGQTQTSELSDKPQFWGGSASNCHQHWCRLLHLIPRHDHLTGTMFPFLPSQ